MTRISLLIAECRREFSEQDLILDGMLGVLFVVGWVVLGVVVR